MVYGFIGLGNMAGAIIRGMAGSGSFSADTLCGFNRSPEKTQRLAQETGLVPCESARQVAEQADVLVLGVKPQMLPDVLPLIAPAVTPKTLVVTIAAGKGFDFYASYLGDVPLVRVMPNICAQVLCSASAVCPNSLCSPAQAELVRAMFRTVGEVYDIPEAQFAAFSALGGASGAFVQMYIDALSSAGVKAGRRSAQQSSARKPASIRWRWSIKSPLPAAQPSRASMRSKKRASSPPSSRR